MALRFVGEHIQRSIPLRIPEGGLETDAKVGEQGLGPLEGGVGGVSGRRGVAGPLAVKNAVRGLCGSGQAPQLIPEALDVVEAVADDDLVPVDVALDVLLQHRPCLLLGVRPLVPRRLVDPEGLLVDEEDGVAAGLEVRLEGLGAGGLAAAREAAD